MTIGVPPPHPPAPPDENTLRLAPDPTTPPDENTLRLPPDPPTPPAYAAAQSRLRTVWGVPYWPMRPALEALVRRRLARDIFFLQISNGLQRALGFGFSIVIARVLGVTWYGEYLLVLSLYSTLNLLGNLGVGQFLVVPLAQAVATRDRGAIARGTGYTLKFGLILGMLVVLAVLLAGEVVGDLIMHRPDLGNLTRIVVAGLIPSVAYNVAITSLQSGRRMSTLAVVEIFDLLVGRGCAVFFVLAGIAGGGVTGVLWGTVVGGAISAVHAVWWYWRIAVRHDEFPGLASLVRAGWSVPMGTYFRFSAIASVDKNIAQLFGQTPMLLLGRYAGPEEAAYFGIAGKVFTLLASLHGGASRALSVRLSQEMGQRGPASTRRLFWRGSLAWGGASAVGAIGLLAALPVFRIAYGPEYLPSVALVAVHGALQAKQGLTVALGAVYLIAGRVATNAMLKIPLIMVAVPWGMWLVEGWGAMGAAVYQLTVYVAGDVVYLGLILTPWFWQSVGGSPSFSETRASSSQPPTPSQDGAESLVNESDGKSR